MEMTKSKFIEEINTTYFKLSPIEEKLKSVNLNIEDKSKKIEIGGLVLSYQTLISELFTSINLFLKLGIGELSDLDSKISSFYKEAQELKSPVSDEDNEDVKKFKEYLNSIKNA